jgi:hypothetical protein
VVGGTNSVVPAVYPLELVSPRAAGTSPIEGGAAMPSGHRIFKAYPGIEYNIKAVVIGGSYPYTFALDNAPTGMTIDADTGEISWPSPDTTASDIEITVTDAESTIATATWSITVTSSTNDFVFCDVNAETNGSGSISSPYNTFGALRSGTNGTGTANKIVYFRAGTYSVMTTDPAAVDSYDGGSFTYYKAGWGPVRGSSVKLLAYPGESVTIDHGWEDIDQPGIMFETTTSSTEPIYFENLTIRNAGNQCWKFSFGGAHFGVIRNVTAQAIQNPTGGENPANFMFVSGTAADRQYWAIQDCTVNDNLYNTDGAGGFKFYAVQKVLVENMLAYNCADPFDLKATCPRFEVRGCYIYCRGGEGLTATAGIGGNMNGSGANQPSGEIRYNRVSGRAAVEGYDAAVCDLNMDSLAGRIDVYRNTFVGRCRVRTDNLTGDGPFRWYGNVHLHEEGTTYASTGDIAHFDSASPLDVIVTDLDTDGGSLPNLRGAVGSGIVNEAGDLALQGSYRTTYLGSRGHEIP